MDLKQVEGRPDSASVRCTPSGVRIAPRRAKVLLFCEALLSPYLNADNKMGNLVRALLTRVYIPSATWKPIATFNTVLHRAASRLGRQLGQPLTPDQVEEVLQVFPGRKRELYREGLAKVCQPHLNTCTAFVKDEWIPVKPGKPYKPRVIQFRSAPYLSHLIHVYKPIEHSFYRGRYLFNRFQKYTCAKGANPHNRMTYLIKLVSELKDPVVVDLDGSAFDAHVSKGALRAEWRFYEKAADQAGWPREKIELLRAYARSQLVNKCVARCKDGSVHYRVEGNRMSGDLNTGCGNSVLQSCFIAAAMEHLEIPESDWRMYVDGDDASLLVERAWTTKLAELPRIFEGFSQEVKVGEIKPISVDNMESLEFCQARPVRVNGKWRLVRNPNKVINCYLRSFRWSTDTNSMKRYMATISPPEMIINSDVPILDRFFKICHEMAGDAKPLESVARNYWRRTVAQSELQSYQPVGVISEDTRASFAKAFGISQAEQLVREELIAAQRGKTNYLQL